METKRVFVTGATGFVGRHLVAELAHKGHIVTCLARAPEKLRSLGQICARAIIGDLKNPGKLEKHINGQDVVFHLAAIRGEWKISWDKYYRVNVEATKRLLEFSANAGVSKFVFVSSVGVLGTSPNEVPADEKTPHNPDSRYHKSKMLAEQAVLKWAEFLNTTIIRPTITYGPYDVGFLYRTAKIVKRGFFPVVNKGDNKIHILYVKGLVKTLIESMMSTHNSGQIYIVADKRPIKFRNLVSLIGALINEKVKIINIPSKPFLNLAKTYDRVIAQILNGRSMEISFKLLSLPWHYSIRKVVNEMGYQPYQTEEKVKDTLLWYVERGLL